MGAQRRVSADVEVKSVKDGKASTIRKSLWCNRDGRMVTHFNSPREFYVVSNFLGESAIYDPFSNEVVSSASEDQSSKGELLMIFLSGRVDDLALSSYGYSYRSKRMDGKILVKTFSSDNPSKRSAAEVEIAYDNFLPVYVGYKDASGRVISKKYLSHYSEDSGFLFPHRMVDILYSKKDSTVVRTVYSNVAVDSLDAMFDYEIPSDAKAVPLK